MKYLQKYMSILAAFAGLVFPSVSVADLLISIDDLNQSSGSGSFKVTLANTEGPGGTTYQVAAFSFELLSAPGSGLEFTAADYPTSGSPPYIFDGTGQTSVDPTILLSSYTFANTHFSGADSEFTQSWIPVAPGDGFSLGLVSFTAASPVSLGDLQSLIVKAGTVLSDENFDPIPYSLPGIAVPEPSTLTTACLAVALGLAGASRRSESWFSRKL